MDDLDRPANKDEIGKMQAMVREALGAGAIGVSTGHSMPIAGSSHRMPPSPLGL